MPTAPNLEVTIGVDRGTTHDLDTSDTDDSDIDSADWFCIWTKVQPCGCGVTMPYVHYTTERRKVFVVVWPAKDDPEILRVAAKCKDITHDDVQIKPYEQGLGPCISWYNIP